MCGIFLVLFVPFLHSHELGEKKILIACSVDSHFDSFLSFASGLAKLPNISVYFSSPDEDMIYNRGIIESLGINYIDVYDEVKPDLQPSKFNEQIYKIGAYGHDSVSFLSTLIEGLYPNVYITYHNILGKHDFDVIVSDWIYFGAMLDLSQLFKSKMIAFKTFSTIEKKSHIFEKIRNVVRILPKLYNIHQFKKKRFGISGNFFFYREFQHHPTLTNGMISYDFRKNNFGYSDVLVGPLLNFTSNLELDFKDEELIERIDNNLDNVIFIDFGRFSHDLKYQIDKILDSIIKNENEMIVMTVMTPEKYQFHAKRRDGIIIWEAINEQAVLNHPKVKVLITLGDMESIFRSIHSLTPMIVIPIRPEQKLNGELVEMNGIGYLVEIENIDVLCSRIEDIILRYDDFYLPNLERMKNFGVLDSGLERAIRYVQFFLEVENDIKREKNVVGETIFHLIRWNFANMMIVSIFLFCFLNFLLFCIFWRIGSCTEELEFYKNK